MADSDSSSLREIRNERKRAKRAANGAIVIGSRLTCKNCGGEFLKEHKRQFYCSPCMELCANDALPANRVRQAKYQAARNKVKRATDPSFSIRERMTAQIGNALREKKSGRSWEALVGYSLSELMEHLERQFLKGMTWENRAEWHIDHITPLATFRFSGPDDPEIAKAWALSNLRPLWSGENIRKRDRRTHLI